MSEKLQIIMSKLNILGGPADQLILPFIYDYEYKFDLDNLEALFNDREQLPLPYTDILDIVIYPVFPEHLIK